MSSKLVSSDEIGKFLILPMYCILNLMSITLGLFHLVTLAVWTLFIFIFITLITHSWKMPLLFLIPNICYLTSAIPTAASLPLSRHQPRCTSILYYKRCPANKFAVLRSSTSVLSLQHSKAVASNPAYPSCPIFTYTLYHSPYSTFNSFWFFFFT